MLIKSSAEFLDTLENGPYAWPGGYPLYFVMADCEALSFKAAQENISYLLEAFEQIEDVDPTYLDRFADQWLPVAVEINWENNELYCAHTNELIESAYGEDSPSTNQ